jgi:hypothetical protein
MPEVDVPSRTWTVTRRRDRTGLVYLRDGNGLWWCPQWTRRWPLAELEAAYGPTVPFDVDDVEALLADYERVRQQLDEAQMSIRGLLGLPVHAGPQHRRRMEANHA